MDGMRSLILLLLLGSLTLNRAYAPRNRPLIWPDPKWTCM